MDEQQLPQGKQFSLDPTTQNYLKQVKGNLDATFALVLTQLAATKLAYQPTANTQFNLVDKFTKLIISENTAAGVPQPPDQKPPTDNSGVKVAE